MSQGFGCGFTIELSDLSFERLLAYTPLGVRGPHYHGPDGLSIALCCRLSFAIAVLTLSRKTTPIPNGTNEALQIFAGYGYTKMFPVEKILIENFSSGESSRGPTL